MGLANHKYAEGGGSGNAAEALRQNFTDARDAFAESVSEARAAAAEHAVEQRAAARAAAAMVAEGGGEGESDGLFTPRSRAMTPGGRRLAERMQFGWLGIPKGDLQAAEELRRVRGARRIQRVARAWLAKRAAARGREEAVRAAADAADARRHAAAAVFQARIRGATGRRRAAAFRVQRTARGYSASRIQRMWRRHRTRLRERAATKAKAFAVKEATARWVASRASFVAAWWGCTS